MAQIILPLVDKFLKHVIVPCSRTEDRLDWIPVKCRYEIDYHNALSCCVGGVCRIGLFVGTGLALPLHHATSSV